jgi:potassium-transporting ATPase KdpC subunit
MFARYIRPAACLTIAMTLLLGVIYPLVITAVGSVLFPSRAAGSLIYAGETLLGSRLIGQKFSDPKYFWGRPSATSPQPYNGLASGGSNLGPLNPALLDAVKANVKLLHDADPGNTKPIPVELVTASASGLDPDISLAAADYQASRVAQVRHIPLSTIQSLIRQHATGPFIGIVGEPTVNVLELNLALDSLH